MTPNNSKNALVWFWTKVKLTLLTNDVNNLKTLLFPSVIPPPLYIYIYTYSYLAIYIICKICIYI